MTVTLPSDLQKLVEEQIAAGSYATVEDVLRASIAALSAQQSFGDFAPGELDAILERGAKSLRERGGIPAEDVYARIEAKSAKVRDQRS